MRFRINLRLVMRWLASSRGWLMRLTIDSWDLRTLSWSLDPALMFTAALGHDPDPWQEQALRAEDERLLLLCARQMGKSTVSAVLALHSALFAGGLVLLLSPSQRQSSELFLKVMACYNALERPIPPVKKTELTLTLANGGRIVSLPGEEGTIRGYSEVKLLILDEAARIPDELLVATSPMRAVSKGRMIALSTPLGRRGWFYEAWNGEGADWRKIRATACDCPRIKPQTLDSERRILGERMFKQEYECSFEEIEDQYFSTQSIEDAFASDVEPLFCGESLFGKLGA